MKILDIKPVIMKTKIHTFYIAAAFSVEQPNNRYSGICKKNFLEDMFRMKQMLDIFDRYLIRNRTSGDRIEFGGNFCDGFFKAQFIAYKSLKNYQQVTWQERWHLLEILKQSKVPNKHPIPSQPELGGKLFLLCINSNT